MKKHISMLLVFCIVLSGCISAYADDAKMLDGQIVILHTNDMHGHVLHGEETLGYSFISAAKKNLEARGAFVILVDAGDACQGMPIVNLSHGANAVDFMNRAGYDIAVPGNHEFDWGIDNLLLIEENAEYEYLCANILNHISGESIFKERLIVDCPDGFKIGFFGLDTPGCMTKVLPDKIRGLEFLGEEALVQCAQAQIDALKNNGANYVVCIGHLGEDEESIPNRSVDLIQKIEGLDLFIDAHSHTLIDGGKIENDTFRVSAGSYSNALGYVVLAPDSLENGSMIGNVLFSGLYTADENIETVMAAGASAVDDELEAYICKINDEVQAELGAPFAKSKVFLNGERAPGNRTEETNLGDLTADAILWAANQNSPVEVAAAVTNGGGIRSSVEAGDISMLLLKTVFPNDNTVSILTVPGAALLEVLEAATYSLPEAIGGFPQVSGIVYEIDTTAEWMAGEQYPDSTYFAPAAPGTRVTIRTVGGKEFDPDAFYTIATNNFSAAGGDQYYAFRYSYKTAGIDTGLAIEDAVAAYTQEVLNGVIGEEYAEPAGRITVITDREALESAA